MYPLEAKNIFKSYAGHQALKDVSISVSGQQIYGLLGPNGAGKTTLIRIINHITAPDSGEVLWEGRPMQPSDIAHIGYLPEERGLYKKMKVGEQALYLARLKGLSKQDAQVRLKYWFDKFDISAWSNRKLEELSKGMAQKIQFIITVLHEPKLLIFDEPFSGFDPVNVQLLKEEILYLKNQGATVIFSTHNMSSVEEICDEISLINKSEVVLQGNVNDIRRQYNKGIYVLKADATVGAIPQGRFFETLSSEEKNGKLKLQIQKKADISTRELLTELSSLYEIRGFEEEISSMNDIFIQTVQP
ncbi:MAG TPA: ATP-binding cassette domain-containing protein [Bacteroidales bacterium]|nr:ATP-binding cassette domain-containing protein [Bacteroidales bacterium]